MRQTYNNNLQIAVRKQRNAHVCAPCELVVKHDHHDIVTQITFNAASFTQVVMKPKGMRRTFMELFLAICLIVSHAFYGVSCFNVDTKFAIHLEARRASVDAVESNHFGLAIGAKLIDNGRTVQIVVGAPKATMSTSIGNVRRTGAVFSCQLNRDNLSSIQFCAEVPIALGKGQLTVTFVLIYMYCTCTCTFHCVMFSQLFLIVLVLLQTSLEAHRT